MENREREVENIMQQGKLQSNKPTLAKIAGENLSIILTFKQQVSDSASVRFIAVFKPMKQKDIWATYKRICLLASVSVGLLHMIAVSNMIQAIKSDPGRALGYSKLVVVVMPSIGWLLTYKVTIIGTSLGEPLDKLLAFIIFVCYVLFYFLFDLRLSLLINQASLRHANLNDEDWTNQKPRRRCRSECIFHFMNIMSSFFSYWMVFHLQSTKYLIPVLSTLPVIQVIHNLCSQEPVLPDQFDLMFALLARSVLLVDLGDSGVCGQLPQQRAAYLDSSALAAVLLGMVFFFGSLVSSVARG